MGAGTVIFMPGTFVASPMATFAKVFLWQGKVVNPVKGELKNRIFPFSFKGIRAKVYPDTSWLDERECTLLDYSKTSLVAKPIRDEIRLVAPGLYLGIVYIGKKKTVDFALDFNEKPAGFVTRLKRAFGAG